MIKVFLYSLIGVAIAVIVAWYWLQSDLGYPEPFAFAQQDYCPATHQLWVNAKPREFVAPATIQGMTNPAIGIFNNEFRMGIAGEDFTLIRLEHVPVSDLTPGVHSDDTYELSVANASFSDTVCTTRDDDMHTSVFFTSNGGSLQGCFQGRVYCADVPVDVQMLIPAFTIESEMMGG